MRLGKDDSFFTSNNIWNNSRYSNKGNQLSDVFDEVLLISLFYSHICTIFYLAHKLLNLKIRLLYIISELNFIELAKIVDNNIRKKYFFNP